MTLKKEQIDHDEQTLEAFLAVARKKDILTMFEEWYRKKNAEEPEAFPLGIYTGEWLDALADFLYHFDESNLKDD